MNWFFRPQIPGEITRDPIIGEFFSTEAIDNPAEALVREGIQNALDAKLDQTNQEVTVRILLVTKTNVPSGDKISRWLDGLWKHLHVSGNGLRDVPNEKDGCPFLVFEDFGTTGLQGNVMQPFDLPGKKNPFFYFFRAEGRSGKSEGDRGRWGIGKHVFPRSSVISTYFGFTVRADDGGKFLMGHTILKSHQLDGQNFAPDGYFGEQSPKGILMLPVSDESEIKRFCNDFYISRQDEPGLSIVVPFVDSEFTLQNIKEAVIADYFYPILRGELIVRIDTLNDIVQLDAKSLLMETASLEGNAKDALVPLIEFADWVVSRSAGKEYVLNPCISEVPSWSDDLIPDNIIEKMRSDLDNGKKMALHVGINVRRKGKPPVLSHFNVFLCQDGYDSGHPIFIRDGLIISDIHSPRARGVRSLVIIEDRGLSTLLGDSENPAHTQWQKDSSNFKNKYPYGKNYIEFVIRIVSNLVNALAADEEQKDPYLFADIFSLPIENEDDQTDKSLEVSSAKSGRKNRKTEINVNQHEKRFQITKIRGGFKIHPGDTRFELPVKLNVHVAYDVRKGNPLKKYDPSDFVLDTAPIKYKKSLLGLSIVNIEKNLLQIEIVESDFQLVVTGFDEKRDLYIKIDPDEV